MAAQSLIEVIPTGATLAADVRGVDLSRPETIDEAVFQAILDAWHEHLVLRFQGQKLSEDALLHFSRRFGALDRAPITVTGKPWLPDYPEIGVISNIKVDGKPAGSLGHYESKWHTDMSYAEVPPKASILYAVEVPPAGADTGFLSMYQAYETLPEDVKRRIQGLHCKHDATRNSVGEVRHGFKESYDDPHEMPGAIHPLVRLHSTTGRKALYLGRRRNAFVMELPVAESNTLLDYLWEHTTKPALEWYQKWRVGDVVIWDNRCVMHRRDAFDPTIRRRMLRTQIRDEKPVLEAVA